MFSKSKSCNHNLYETVSTSYSVINHNEISVNFRCILNYKGTLRQRNVLVLLIIIVDFNVFLFYPLKV